MCLRALLLAAVLFCSESSVHGSPEKVCVSAGGVVILPCSFPPNDVFRTLEWSKTEWSKTDQEKVIVFLFRDNREDLVEQSPLYVSRTNLVEDLKSGNASLRISNIQAADEGTYQCMRMWNKDQQNITEVELSVVGGFTLECEATSVGSDAEITFLDENGKNLSADDPKKNVSRGCYTVQRRVTLQEAASRVTCRVQRADTNETRETQIQLPVKEPKSCSHTAVYTVLVTVAVTVLVTVAVTVLVIVFVLRYRSALVFSLLKKYCKTESSGESATNGAEHLGLLDVRVENKNTKNATIEKLQTEVADLKSKLNQKNQTICKLQRTNTKLTKKNWTKSQEMEKTIGNLQNNTNPQPLEADDSPPEEGNLSNDSDLPLLRQRQFCSL